MRGTVTSYRLTYVQEGSHLEGLYQLTTPEEQQAYQLHDWEPDSPIELSTPEPRGLRQEYDLSSDWLQRFQPLIPSFEAFLQWHGGPQGQVSEQGDRS